MKNDKLQTIFKSFKGLTKKLKKRGAGLKRRTSRFVATRRSQGFAGTALRAVILDGRTLNIDIAPATAEWREAEIWIVDPSGNRLLRLDAVQRPGGNLTATADLSQLGNPEKRSVLPLTMALRGKSGSLRLTHNDFNPNADVVRDKPGSTDGSSNRTVTSMFGEKLAVQIVPAEPAVQVAGVDTSLYRIRAELSSFRGEVSGVRCKLRETDLAVDHHSFRKSGANRILVDLDLDALSRVAATERIASPSVWDVFVKFNGQWQPARKTATDLVNPRWVVRYSTVSFASDYGPNRFRPYWTLGGNLAIEHFSLLQQVKEAQ